ncbi:YheU family protein [Hydrocarboniclastica marina]|uniref:YheU family protein n=1 Tax=Hydrocarboniclastica marina TaxID=2259620 RepID=A0A4P7XCF4_9ALTE|nr:YheU family protein [Hydrocarboniclastica marina]MAL97964.1 hypothetical protein [Alteromonadaceae bacterium]QCF24518.1 hypothetical protein soil367_00285 [Hydrocarboniclastica marina]|tara:strand:- start:152 stop:397 length:246 start_codon:yes stop_codon:yes gene_type:complete
MIISADQLSHDALEALVDEYCLREHGVNETEDPLGPRKLEVHRQLEQGKLLILYTPNNPNQVATLVPREKLSAKELGDGDA